MDPVIVDLCVVCDLSPAILRFYCSSCSLDRIGGYFSLLNSFGTNSIIMRYVISLTKIRKLLKRFESKSWIKNIVRKIDFVILP